MGVHPRQRHVAVGVVAVVVVFLASCTADDADSAAADAPPASAPGTPVATVDPPVEALFSSRRASARIAAAVTVQAVATEPSDVAPIDDTPDVVDMEPVRPLARPSVVLYGDSLAWEAQDAFVQALSVRPDLEVTVRTFGGTAICDWLDQMADDAATFAPGMVVVEFSGNSFTSCMHADDGMPLPDAAVTERYAADAEAAIATFAPIGTQVVFAGAPPSMDSRLGRLNDLYRQIALRHDGVRYTDAGASVVAEDASFTVVLPCLDDEPCVGGLDGQNVVRAADGIHFCPAGGEADLGVTGTCPVWSSGAHRYGRALAAPVFEHIDASTLVTS